MKLTAESRALQSPSGPRTVRFLVEGEPKPQPRARAFVLGGRARVYDPRTAEGWKGRIAAAARLHAPAEPHLRGVSVLMHFLLPRPASHYGTGANAANLRRTAPRFHTSRPDLDNLAKAVLDAIGDLRFWRDDAQVHEVVATKSYADYAPMGAEVIINLE